MHDKAVLITGAARGQGAAEAELFCREGARVTLADIRDELGERQAEALRDAGHQAIYRRLDVASGADWNAAVADAEAEFGALDVLVNNAGVVGFDGVADTSDEEWARVVAVNQTGVFLGMREAVRVMRKRKSGSIVNISSIWGSAAAAGAHAYHAAKGAVRNMTKNAAMTYVADGIRVNSVHPGFIDTPLTQAQAPELNKVVIASTPMKRGGKPIEVAYGCLFLACDESSYVTGAELAIDGGYLAQ
jgi:NAD(P)-dependent dehydrogenase (short-subunit alcohol dehydrogenase family)